MTTIRTQTSGKGRPMAASSDAKHRHRRSVTRRRPSSPTWTGRLLRSIGAVFAVALVLICVGGPLREWASARSSVRHAGIGLVDKSSPLGWLVGDAAPALTTTALPAANSFDDSLHYLLDDLLGVGNKTLPQLIVGNHPNLTVGELLNMASPSTTVDTSLHLSDAFHLLGLGNINVAEVMAALSLPVLKPGTTTPTTFNDVLDTMQLSNVKLDQILAPLGVPHTQTLYGLVDRFSSVNETLATLMQRVGPIGDPMTQTVQQALQSIGLGGFYSGWFTGCNIFNIGLCMLCGGVTGTVEAAMNCIHTEYSNADSQHPNITLSSQQTAAYLLTHIYQLVPGTTNADFSKPVGNYTIGEMLGFDGNTTIKQLVNGPTGYEADPNHVGIWINPQVTIGQWQNGIVDGSPSGPSVITDITGAPWRGYTHHIGNNYGGGQTPNNQQNTHAPNNQLPWHYHTSGSNPGPMVDCNGGVANGGCSNVQVNEAPSDGHHGTHYPPENNLPNSGGIFSQGGPDGVPVDNLQKLGDTAWGDLLSWINLAPNKSLADVLSDFWVSDKQLGYYNIGDALMGMVTNPGALGTGLTDQTLVTDFMNAIGWGNLTLDDFIGLH